MERQTVHEVTYNADGVEGRGPTKVLARFDNRQAAEDVVRDPRYARWCVMGVHQPEHDVKYAIRQETITVYRTAAEFWDGNEKARKREALAKLSAEDRRVLGLDNLNFD